MTDIAQQIKTAAALAVKELYSTDIDAATLQVEYTNKDHQGDFTLVVFPLLRVSRKKPEETGTDIGNYLQANLPAIANFNVIKGFLNLTLANSYWVEFLNATATNPSYGRQPATGKKVVVEYTGPNTNKPLHLGHVRNMLIGYSVATILEFAGNQVVKVNIYNDRGIAICKSMLAWQKFGNGETPESAGIKGDHLMGKYYVEFETRLKAELAQLQAQGLNEEEALKQSTLQQEAQAMLLRWEANDPETIALWKTMNDWVYAGFNETYAEIGVDFEKNYYESETYLLGKDLIKAGLDKGVLYRKDDGSVWIDLTEDGLDEKILLRRDGTSVYLTQDLGTAQLRYEDFKMHQSIYVVANEQDYHFKVLKLCLEKLGMPFASGIFHLSYGMVDLPTGRMKSREGTVVDADDLIAEMIATAQQQTEALGKVEDMESNEAKALFKTIGLGALKFFILRVDPKKRMIFNPEESIELQGQTGPFVQYTYARIQSVKQKAGAPGTYPATYTLNAEEREVAFELYKYPEVIKEAATNLDPSAVANYAYTLAKTYNKFYQEHSVANADTADAKNFRLQLSHMVGQVLASAFKLLGIEVPKRM